MRVEKPAEAWSEFIRWSARPFQSSVKVRVLSCDLFCCEIIVSTSWIHPAASLLYLHYRPAASLLLSWT